MIIPRAKEARNETGAIATPIAQRKIRHITLTFLTHDEELVVAQHGETSLGIKRREGSIRQQSDM